MRRVVPLLLLGLPVAEPLPEESSKCNRLGPSDALIVVDVQNCFMESRPTRVGAAPEFALPGGWSSTIPAGSLQVPGSSGIIDVINGWIDFAAAGSVYATLDYHPADHCSFCHTHGGGVAAGTYCVTGVAQSPEVYAPSLNLTHRCRDAISEADFLTASYFQFPQHCVAGTMGARFDPYLRLGPDTTVLKLGLEEMRDEYSAFGGGRVSSAPAGAHDNQSTTHSLLAPPRANELRTRLEEAGVKRIFVLGLAIDFIVKRTILDALAPGSNWSVALVAPGSRALYGDGERRASGRGAAGRGGGRAGPGAPRSVGRSGAV